MKVRLILLWIATSDKVDQDQLQELLSYARLNQEHKDALENISLLGVQLSKTANKQGEKTKKKKKHRESVQQEVPFDLSRYVPVVKRIVEGHVNDTIDSRLFPNLRAAKSNSIKRDKSEIIKEVPKLRVYNTQWHKKSAGVAVSFFYE
jgi:syntaxin-binding protein 1